MDLTESARFVRLLSLAAAVAALPGCVVESSDPDPYVGCASMDGALSAGEIPLQNERGAYFSFESYIYPDYFIRHSEGRGMISTIENAFDGDDATFQIVPGLADDRCISFESRNYPGSYLRHQNSEVFLDAWSSDSFYLQDATFCPRPGLADSQELSFESCNYPGEFLHIHGDDLLYVDPGSGFDYEDDTTFILEDPWSP